MPWVAALVMLSAATDDAVAAVELATTLPNAYASVNMLPGFVHVAAPLFAINICPSVGAVDGNVALSKFVQSYVTPALPLYTTFPLGSFAFCNVRLPPAACTWSAAATATKPSEPGVVVPALLDAPIDEMLVPTFTRPAAEVVPAVLGIVMLTVCPAVTWPVSFIVSFEILNESPKLDTVGVDDGYVPTVTPDLRLPQPGTQ